MTPFEATKIVRGILCRGLSHEQSEQILRATMPVKAEAGLLVFKEGERPQGLMVLLEGTVEVFKTGSSGLLATLTAPTVLGEISLLTEGRHTASVRAKTACEFSLLTTTQFQRLLREESLAAYKVITILAEVLARRLHRMDEKFVEIARVTDWSSP
jgi:CRP/FNR family transcriptional regulator, cyclic AMP receptor protein